VTIKRIRDVQSGDRVELVNGGIVTIQRVEKFSIVDTADGPAYEVSYHDKAGGDGKMLLSGTVTVEVLKDENGVKP
jgi:hypothetical protein